MRTREILVFLFFFALAGIFWLLMTLNETFEQEVRVPARYVNIPQNVVLTSDETDTLRFTVRDKGISLLTYIYKDKWQTLDIDFQRYALKNGTGKVSSADLIKMVRNVLPASAKPVSVKPDEAVFTYNYGQKKQVPVRCQGVVEPEQFYFISDTIFSTGMVTVYAAPSKLDSITAVYTEPLNCKGFRKSISVNARLQKMSGVKIVPDKVNIQFVTDMLTEVSINDIPVKCEGMPSGMVLRTFPAKVSVSFVTGRKSYQGLTPDDFEVMARYAEIAGDSTTTCNIYLTRQPEGIQRVRLQTNEVEYLIEEH